MPQSTQRRGYGAAVPKRGLSGCIDGLASTIQNLIAPGSCIAGVTRLGAEQARVDLLMADRHAPSGRMVAVTGASGFVGSYLYPELESRGYKVLRVPRSLLSAEQSTELSDFLGDHGVTDIVHLAAQSNPAGGDHRLFYADNAFLTDRLLGACVSMGLGGRFLYVSATSVYGQSDQPFEETAPMNPLNHYAASKMLAETFVGWRRGKLDVAIARPSNCIGRGQKQHYLVPKLVSAFRSLDPEITMGNIRISRDFVDVRDAVDILRNLLEGGPDQPNIANASSGKAVSIAEVIELLGEITGHRPAILYDPRFARSGDILFQACRNDAALCLGHRPGYTLQETLEWMLDAD